MPSFESFWIGAIQVVIDGEDCETRLAWRILYIELGSKPFASRHHDCVASHFFFIVQSDVAGSLRLQLDGVSRAVGGTLRGYVAAETHDHPATGRTIVPSLWLQLMAQDLRVVDLLMMLVEGGVDDAPLNQNQVGCHRWCYWAMKLMEE
ncbi:uncharacterized protein ARMOST_14705 [Armillaria ostoyae]|uniref:Uncharacterized protein n=1 Tax=Armillaria ostoyae TaxID=47428 RepID=A0A284RRA7_ARMOS|nr:uncharacterized protein ARMOST_14705 [Armillaria ostoyae]